ncbi:hypothetical protein ES702_02619 [subsurface metagenome]
MSLDDFDRFWFNARQFVDNSFKEILDFLKKDYILISGDTRLLPAITYAIFPRQTYEFIKNLKGNEDLTKEDYEKGCFEGSDDLNYIQINILPQNSEINFPILLWKRDVKVKNFFDFSDNKFKTVMNIVFKKKKDVKDFNKDFEKGLTLRYTKGQKIFANINNIPDVSIMLYCYPKKWYFKNAERFLKNVKNDFLEGFPNMKKW